MRYSIPFLFLTVFFCEFSLAQREDHLNILKPDSIPFILTEYNNISVQSIINHTDTLNLMLHTAINDVSLTVAATSEMKSINFDHQSDVESWGGKSESRYSTNNKLSIGLLDWENVMMWESEHSGHLTDGKFGLNLFDSRYIELDMEKQVLVLRPELPSDIETYEQLDLILEDGMMYVKGKLVIEEIEYQNEFLIHSGYSGSLLFDDAFVKEHSIGEKLTPIKESILKDSYGNELKTINAILPNFELGTIDFQSLPVGFFEGEIQRQHFSVLGGDVLKRFNIIFDFENSFIYLRPNSSIHSAYYSK